MDNDMKKYIEELSKDLMDVFKKETSEIKSTYEYKESNILRELHRKVDEVKALQSYDYGKEKYYILTKENGKFIMDLAMKFIIESDRSYQLYLNGLELEKGLYYMEVKKDRFILSIDRPNCNIEIYSLVIGSGYVFRLDYSRNIISITEIK